MGDPETLHQIKLIAKNVQLLEDLLYSHNHRHVYNGGDPLFGLDASQIETGIFDIDRIPVMDDAHIPDVETLSYTNPFALAQIPTPLKSKILSEVFTAGADITAGQVVAITDDNEVSPADDVLRSQCIGVALNDAAVGEQVEVVIYGKTTVVADGVISAGDPLAAAITAGRVVSLLSHSHTNPNTSSVDLAHTHGVGTLSIGAVGNHRHNCPTTGSAGGHSHGAGTLTADSAGAHTHTNPNTSSVDLAHTHSFTPSGNIGNTSINHRHDFTPSGSIRSISAGTPSGSISTSGTHSHVINTDSVQTSSAGDPAHTHSYEKPRTPTVAAGLHSHAFTGDTLSAHAHDFIGSAGYTGYTDPSHNHSFTGSAGTTGSALGSHSHTQGSTGSAGTHGHTISGSTASVGSHTHSVGYTTYAGGHSHSITGSTGSALGLHSHTQGNTGAVNNAQIVGKALTAAAGADESIDILVCLAG